MSYIEISRTPLDVADLLAAGEPVAVSLSGPMRAGVRECRDFVERCLSGNVPVYGSTTGFGPLVTFSGRPTAPDQCDNVLQHLTAGQGADLPSAVVRATVLVRLWSLAQGRSGVSESVLDTLCAMLGTTFCPVVPSLGSVGASGDLVPMAHLAHALRGSGEAWVDGRRVPAEEGLRLAGLTRLELDGRDALALVNGTSVTTAAAGLALASIRSSVWAAAALTALLADLLGASPAFLSPSSLRAFGHPAVEEVGGWLSEWLNDGEPSGDRPLQEPYSIRCSPHLIGSALEAVEHAAVVIGRDLGGISDNPLFFAEENLVAHGGNFFGQPAAFAADQLSSVAAQLGNLAERQLDLLVDPHRNGGRPPMLATVPGEQHGVQGVQLVATATVVAMRRAAVPAAMQSVPTNWHNQDVVPFGTQAALTAIEQAQKLRVLHGCLAVALRQAAYVGRLTGRREASASRCAELLEGLGQVVAPIEADRALAAEVRQAADFLDSYLREQVKSASERV